VAEAGYLEKLNDNRQIAVEFGVGVSPPLPVIAGTESGKTNTLSTLSNEGWHRFSHALNRTPHDLASAKAGLPWIPPLGRESCPTSGLGRGGNDQRPRVVTCPHVVRFH